MGMYPLFLFIPSLPLLVLPYLHISAALVSNTFSLYFMDIYIIESSNMQYSFFLVWFLSFSVIIFTFIHVVCVSKCDLFSIYIDRCVCSVAQSCPILCDPMDCSLPGSFVHGIFSRQEYWSGLPSCTLRVLPDPGFELAYLAFPTLAGGFLTTVPPGKSHMDMPPIYLFIHFSNSVNI